MACHEGKYNSEDEFKYSTDTVNLYTLDSNRVGKITMSNNSAFINIDSFKSTDTIIKETVIFKEKPTAKVNSNKFNLNKYIGRNVVIEYVGFGNITVKKKIKGTYSIIVGENSYLQKISILGNKEALNDISELVIEVENNASSSPLRFIMQVFDMNNGSILDHNSNGIVLNQKFNSNKTKLMIPGLHNFTDKGYQIELR